MERILKILDDLDDVVANVRHRAPRAVTTTLLLVAFAAVITVLFVYGPPDLHAAN